MNRCNWIAINKNPKYLKYHDEEWGILCTDEHYLYEMFILETFQAGLSWECILNKREAFKEAYDNFNIDKICSYDETKINQLLSNPLIIRNKLKVKASIKNSQIYKEIVKEYKSFYNYLCQFTDGKVIYEVGNTTNNISDAISKDLTKRGMAFVGSITIYSYLQAVGIINSHEPECFLYKRTIK